MWGVFFSDVEECPLLVEHSEIVRVVEWSPRWGAYPVHSWCVLTGEGRSSDAEITVSSVYVGALGVTYVLPPSIQREENIVQGYS